MVMSTLNGIFICDRESIKCFRSNSYFKGNNKYFVQ